MKPAICVGCGRNVGTVPYDAEGVVCFACNERQQRERDAAAAASRFVSGTCKGEPCNMCGSPAEHKVAEVIQFDDPAPARHGLSAYVCHDCFAELMGTHYD